MNPARSCLLAGAPQHGPELVPFFCSGPIELVRLREVFLHAVFISRTGNPMSTIIDKLEKAQLRPVPHFDPGDRVRVHFQVVEGTRRRTQVFEGVVIKRQGSGRETFTVRKQSFGVGVERTFPVHSTKIEKIEVAARGEVRRAKLYYLRDRVGKRARVRERASTRPSSSALTPRQPSCGCVRRTGCPGRSRTCSARSRRDRGDNRRGDRDGSSRSRSD